MKTLIKNLSYKISMLFVLLLSGAYAFAQGGITAEKTATSSTTTDNVIDTSDMWYNAPWVWILAAGIVLLVLFLIFRGGGSDGTRRVTRTTTTTYRTE
jgi:hypothetical protein